MHRRAVYKWFRSEVGGNQNQGETDKQNSHTTKTAAMRSVQWSEAECAVNDRVDKQYNYLTAPQGTRGP